MKVYLIIFLLILNITACSNDKKNIPPVINKPTPSKPTPNPSTIQSIPTQPTTAKASSNTLQTTPGISLPAAEDITGGEDSGGGDIIGTEQNKIKAILEESIVELFIQENPDAMFYQLGLWAVIEIFHVFDKQFDDNTESVFKKILSIGKWSSEESKNLVYRKFFKFEERENFPRNLSISEPNKLLSIIKFEKECFDLGGNKRLASVNGFSLENKICFSLNGFSGQSKVSVKALLYGLLFHELCHLVGEKSEIVCEKIQARVEKYQTYSINLAHGFAFATNTDRFLNQIISGFQTFKIFYEAKYQLKVINDEEYLFHAQRLLELCFTYLTQVQDLTNSRYQLIQNSKKDILFDAAMRTVFILNNIEHQGIPYIKNKDAPNTSLFIIELEKFIYNYWQFARPILFKTMVSED